MKIQCMPGCAKIGRFILQVTVVSAFLIVVASSVAIAARLCELAGEKGGRADDRRGCGEQLRS